MKTQDHNKMVSAYRKMILEAKKCKECNCSPCECEDKKEDEEQAYKDNMKEQAAPQSPASAYRQMWEAVGADRAKHYKGATKPEGWIENESGKSKEFVASHEVKINTDDEKGHDDMEKAGRAGPRATPRRGDSKTGDPKTPQKPTDTTKV